MTRANFLVITENGKFKFQGNSSCYPSYIFEYIVRFATSVKSSNLGAKDGFYTSPDSSDIAEFIENIGLTFGYVGNPTYYYKIDFINREVKIFDTKSKWVNAPIDWEEKGWRGCYQNDKGQFGYMDCWSKGKCIYKKTFIQLVNKEYNVSDKKIK